MGEMRIMGRMGDVAAQWDPSKPDEVAAAKKIFEDLVVVKRYLAFKVDAGGGRGEQVTAFDPAAGKIIVAPPMAGGR